jgi:DNA-binding NarL/FixJ family response regulator
MEPREGLVIIAEESHWSNLYQARLKSLGWPSSLIDPTTEPINPIELRGKVCVIPVSHPGSERFNLVKQVVEAGGQVVVLASRDTPTTALDAGMNGARFCVTKSLDPKQLIEIASRLRR